MLKRILSIAVISFLAFVFGLILAQPAYPQSAAEPAVNPDVPSVVSLPGEAPSPGASPTSVDCLNCYEHSADLIGGAQLTWAQNGGWNLRPFVQATAESPVYLGRFQDRARAYFRAFSDLTIGSTRTGEDPGVDAELGVPLVSEWSEVELVLGVATVIGLSPDGDVETSLYGEIGGSVVIDQDADLEPRVPLIADVGVRFRVRSAGADVRVGLGVDERGLPEDPEVNADGTVSRTLQGVVRARLPMAGTHQVAWFWARGALMLRGEGRPVVMAGLAVSVRSIAGLF